MVAVRGSKTSLATVLDDYGIENVTPSFVYSVMLAKARYEFTARTVKPLTIAFLRTSFCSPLIPLEFNLIPRVSPSLLLEWRGRETSLVTLIEALKTFCSELKKLSTFRTELLE